MKHIKKTVDELVAAHETHDPFLLAHYEKIKVVFEDFDEIKGCYTEINGQRIIVINNRLDEFSRHIVCAHELCHALLHDETEIAFLRENTLFPAHTKAEREANKFAAELILHDGFDIALFYADGQPMDRTTYEKLSRLRG